MPLRRKMFPAATILQPFTAIEKDDEKNGRPCLLHLAAITGRVHHAADFWKNFHHGLHSADKSDIRAKTSIKIKEIFDETGPERRHGAHPLHGNP
jgi:hypothetical protein